MSVTVACPCGKTYDKPNFKAGSAFRCHACGRELTVPLTAPLDVVPFAVEPASAAAKPPPWRPVAGVGDHEDVRPPLPPTGWHTAIAWALIVVGLTAIVGSVGQLYISSLIEKMRFDNADAQARMLGGLHAVDRRPSREGQAAYVAAGVGVVLGLGFAYLGFRWRGARGSPSPGRNRRRDRRRSAPTPADSCPACGAGMTAAAVLCIECGFNRKTGAQVRPALERPPTPPETEQAP
jgi:hypothetical protein